MSKSVYWSIFIGVCIVTVFVRFFALGQIPTSLYWDEAAILVDAKSISQTGYDIHGNSAFQLLFPSYGDYKLPVLLWLASLSVSIFGVSEFAVRLVSAVAGVGTVIVGIFLARELSTFIFSEKERAKKSRYFTLATLLVIGTSFWSIHFSRVAFEGHLGQFFVALSILLTFKARRTSWLYLVAAVVGAVAVYTYYSVRFVWPVAYIVAVLLSAATQFESLPDFLKTCKAKLKTSSTQIAVLVASFVLFFVLLIPMTRSPYYAASQQFRLSADSILQREPQILEANELREQAGNTLVDRLYFHRDVLTVQLLAEHYSKHLSLEYLFLTGDSNLRHGSGSNGLFALILVLPFLVGLYRLAIDRASVLLFLAAWWLISVLPASVPFDVPHALRSLNALVPLSLIIAYGLSHFFVPVGWVQKILYVTFFCILAVQLAQYWHFYIIEYPRLSHSAWQGGYKSLATAVNERKTQYDQVRVLLSDHRFFLWVIADPTYSAQEVQTAEKSNFVVTQIENVYFGSFDLNSLTTQNQSVVLVDERSKLEESLAKNGLKPDSIEVIRDPVNNIEYMFASFTTTP